MKAQLILDKYIQNTTDAARWYEEEPSSIEAKEKEYRGALQHPSSGTNDSWKKQVKAKGRSSLPSGQGLN